MEQKDIKWIEENLGIKRTTIEYYEQKKIIEKKDGKKQKKLYNSDEIMLIWFVKTLIGMGYNHEDIIEIKKTTQENKEYNFSKTITDKIDKMTDEINRIKKHLGVAKYIKKTGRIPISEKIGEMTVEEFMQHIESNVNYTNSGTMSVSKLIEEDIDDDIINMTLESRQILALQMKLQGIQEVYYYEIIRTRNKSSNEKQTQEIINNFYEYTNFFYNKIGKEEKITKRDFSIWLSPRYYEGEIGEYWVSLLGDKNCDYINKQMAIFGKRKEYEGIVNDMNMEEK